MGLFSKRKRRPSRRAEAKALKHKAAMEAKLGAKNDRKAAKVGERAQRKAAKQQARTEAKVAEAQIAALKAEEKAAAAAAKKAERDRFSPSEIRKYIGVARVLVPVLTPLAYRAATFVRGQLDARRAQELGVDTDRLGEFGGPGARLQARIANTSAALDKIAAGETGNGKAKKGSVDKKSSETQQFIASNRSRLDDLTVALRTADQMPAPRRKAVHASISTELSGIESAALDRLGIH